MADLLQPLPYTAMQQLLDPLWGRGARNHMKAGYLGNLGSGAIDALLRGWEAKPSPMSELHVHHMGGAAARVAGDSSAFQHRGAPYVANFISRWTDAGPTTRRSLGPRRRASLERARPAAPTSTSSRRGADRVRAAYGDEAYGCRRSSAKYDPDNAFHATRTWSPPLAAFACAAWPARRSPWPPRRSTIRSHP